MMTEEDYINKYGFDAPLLSAYSPEAEICQVNTKIEDISKRIDALNPAIDNLRWSGTMSHQRFTLMQEEFAELTKITNKIKKQQNILSGILGGIAIVLVCTVIGFFMWAGFHGLL